MDLFLDLKMDPKLVQNLYILDPQNEPKMDLKMDSKCTNKIIVYSSKL